MKKYIVLLLILLYLIFMESGVEYHCNTAMEPVEPLVAKPVEVEEENVVPEEKDEEKPSYYEQLISNEGNFKPEKKIILEVKEPEVEIKEEQKSKEEPVSTEEQVITVSEENNSSVENISQPYIIQVPLLNMGNNYPSACETFSTTMLLNHWGYGYTVDDVINYTPISYLYNDENGGLVGASPYNYFIGDPRSDYGLCCYEPVVEGVLRNLTDGRTSVVNASGQTLEDLCNNYIANGQPVVVWAMVNMKMPGRNVTWRIEGTDEYYSWPDTEHCMLLVGYDENCFYFNDPIDGRLRAFSKGISESCYEYLGMQAVTLSPSN